MSSVKWQYLATFCCNLLTISFGGSSAWSAVNFLYLQSNESPVMSGKLTITELSIVISCLTFGGFIGNILIIVIASRFKRKTLLQLTAIPQIIGWLLLLWPINVIYLCVGRFLVGLAGAAVYVLIPLFISEISDDKIRGTLGSVLPLAANIGVLLEVLLGGLVSYCMQPILFLILSAIFPLVFFAFPESPISLLNRNLIEEADDSFGFYNGENSTLRSSFRSNHSNFTTLIEKPAQENVKHNESRGQILSEFKTKVGKKSLCIGIILSIIQECSGIFVLLNYSISIFAEAESDITPHQSLIVISVIQIIGSYVSVYFIDRAGRKILLMISAFVCGISVAILGVFNYLKELDFPIHHYSFVPLMTLSIIIFIANFGIVPVPYILYSELFPAKIKHISASICISTMWFLDFSLTIFYPFMAAWFGIKGCMLFFSTVCFLSVPFVKYYVPETKGKSHLEIMKMLDN